MGAARTLARWLRRLADRLDPQDVTIDVSGMPVVPYTDAERDQWRSAAPNPATVLGALAPDIPRERICELEAYCDQPVRAGDLECHECGFVLPAGHGRPTRCDRCGSPTTWFPVGTFAWRWPPESPAHAPIARADDR